MIQMTQTMPRQRAWTRDEYDRLTDLGFFQGERLELIEGQIVVMAPMKSPHATATGLADDALRAVIGSGYIIRIQMPFVLGDRSEPEPDVAVVAGPRRAYAAAHPTMAVLLVEVADSSVEYDRKIKGSLYARAGIEDYWIVNLPERQVEVYRRPALDPDAFAGWSYADRHIARAGETVSSLAVPAAVIAVADLLP